MTRKPVILLCATLVAISMIAHGQTKEVDMTVKIQSPLPFQVVQRDPSTVSKGNAGSAKVVMRWPDSAPVASYEWRLVTLQDAFGKGTTWASTRPTVSGTVCTASVALPAGGWYRLEVRRLGSANTSATVEPVGVGEVFLIAGQSYAANCNEERLKVTEPQRRVACLDLRNGSWRVADDPQPGASDHRGGGSIWPPFGDEVAKRHGVPVGLANVAVGGTSSAQWMPGGQLHNNLISAAKKLGSFRAVLWQQGESDVMANTTEEKYIENLKAIRAALVNACGFELTWLPAKSTLHPTVYNNPNQEAVIRAAIDKLWKTRGFFPGPDTDTLTGENRGGAGSKQHFSASGQRHAAVMWVEAVGNLLEDDRK